MKYFVRTLTRRCKTTRGKEAVTLSMLAINILMVVLLFALCYSLKGNDNAIYATLIGFVIWLVIDCVLTFKSDDLFDNADNL